ncbi:PAS domain S-box protein [Pontiellaceae bacterium B1224]|nr:PAS domain S-box protein [Pontiellaceae bacterium B1224]
MKKAVLLIMTGLMVLGALPVLAVDSDVRKIRVGVFQVEPLNFTNENGVADGFNADLLREIAKEQQHWEPEFVPVNWAEGLAGLQSESIDLMMSVTYTAERAELMDYSSEAVLDVWGQVFIRPDSGIESVIDLEGRRVGVMKADVHGKNFIKLTDAFGISCTLVEELSHEALFEAVERGSIDAAVAPNHFGLRHAKWHHLIGTAVQFSPAPIYFAAKKGLQSDVLSDIDEVLSEWKSDEHSYYYRRFNYWFGSDAHWGQTIPRWLIFTIIGSAVLTPFFLILIGLFKREVRLRTRELSASEERYRLIVENQTDLVVKVHPDGRFLYVSPTYCDVFGKTEAELLENAFLPLVHDDDRHSTEVEFNKIFEPPHEAYMEQRAMTVRGWRWFSWQDSAILDESGKVKEIIGIGRDITDRKKAEEDYNKTTERLHLAVQAGKVGVWEYDFEQDNLIWDDQMFALFEVDKSTFDGKFHSWRHSVHPEDLESAEGKFRKAVEKGKTFETEFRVVCRGKQIKYVRALAEVVRDDEGKPVRVIGINWDVSKHRQMVSALMASEQDYRQLFDNMTTGFLQLEVLKGAAGKPNKYRVVQINDAGCTMARMKRADLVGSTLDEIFDPFEDYWEDVLGKVALTGRASSYENRLEALGLVLSTWIFVPRPGYLAVVVSDNTARRTAEDAVLRAQQQLEHILDNTKDVIWQVDLQGNYIYANSSAEGLTGYKLSQILKMNLLELILPEFHDMVKRRLANRIAGRSSHGDFSFMIRCADGTLKWLELATNEVLGADGKLEAIQGVARDITIRKAAERELEESRRFLRAILDMIPVSVFWKDLELNYLGANRTFLDTHGFRETDEIIGKNDLSINSEVDLAEGYMQVDRAVISSGEAQLNFEENLMSVDGNYRTLLTSKMPLRNAENHIVGVLGAYVDVTERKAAEQELEDSRIFLRSIIDTMPSRVFWKDRDSRYLGCNLAFAKDTGFGSPEDLVGKTDYDFGWSATEADLYRDDDRSIMESGIERINFEEPQTRSDGTKFWLSTSKLPMRDSSGKVIGILGAYQDVTARKELEEERGRLSVAINQSAEAIVVMDLKGFIQYVNPAFETVTGYTQQEAIGANLAIIKSGRHEEQFYTNIWRTLEAGASWNGRIINRHKDGSYYTVESALSPVKDSQDQVVNYVVAIRDVSQQVELEEHIRQAQKMDAVGRLAGGVAHDFNNILQSILGFSGILLSEMDKGTSQYDDVAEIRKAARRAGDLTRQLLTLSRKHNVDYAVQDLNAIIRSNEKMMRRLIGERIEFVFELSDDLKPVRADFSQIEQIMLNLFINARDAMPQGGQLLVKTSNVTGSEADGVFDKGLGQICLEVSDTGCGIRDDVRDHLFEPFFTTKQVGEGTGLGLSVVYGIVQQHGGHIEVSSHVGEGAVFKVFLPVCDLMEMSSPEEELSLVADLSLEGHGEAVLVVEDDTVLRDLTNRMLRDAGYAVTAVANVKEANAAMKNTVFSLLLVDMVLPDGSGLELVNSARSAGGEFAVLLCSGYPQEFEVHEAMNINGFRYLEKPIGSMQLLQSVREMLDE